MDEILQALSTLRVSVGQGEVDIHTLVKLCLEKHGFSPLHEVRLAPHKRIDFMCGDIGIEIKRGRPTAKALLPQLEKYLECEELSALIVIVERTANLPRSILGKPVRLLSLNKLWGISL
jgi:hypothetical protein